MRLRRVVERFEEIPRGYGVAWEDRARLTAVCYPVPLNRLLGWLHRIRWELARPPRGPRAEAADVTQILEILTRACDSELLRESGPIPIVFELREARRLAERLHEKLERWNQTP